MDNGLVRVRARLRSDRKVKRRPFALLGLHPDSPAMPLDDFFANGKPNSRPRILIARVQPLKDDKDTLKVLFWDADAIIAHCKVPNTRLLLDTNANFGRTFTAKLDSVANKVLEEL